MGCCSSKAPEPTPKEKEPEKVETTQKTEEKAPKPEVAKIEIVSEEIEQKTSSIATMPLPESLEAIQSLETIVCSFSGLHDIFQMHADKHSKMMDIEGLTDALKLFRLKIDVNPDLHKVIWGKFSLDGAEEIDYNDFMATISALIDTENEDGMFLLFQIFDVDESGYLEVDELGEMIFAQQKLAAAVTNQPDLIEDATNKACLASAKRLVDEIDDNGDGKISFDEYKQYRKKHEIVVTVSTPHTEMHSGGFSGAF